jgi:CHAT domain-containing protein
MQGIPLEALVDEGGRHVGGTFTVSYVSSGTVHAWMREHAPSHRTTMEHILIVGDPALQRLAPDSTSFEPIPASRREVQQVASLVPDAVLLTGKDASEPALVELAHNLDRYDAIHMATHAGIDPTRPERSYLALSQTDIPDPLASAMAGDRIFDGRLTVREIVREWRLDADLVTLSACRTALGRESRGEGFVGFAHAFLQVGARSVVVSLWEVDDEATSRLMGRFYENLTGEYTGERLPGIRGGMPKAAALRESKSWLRTFTDDDGRTPFQHPAYWSSFILVGCHR